MLAEAPDSTPEPVAVLITHGSAVERLSIAEYCSLSLHVRTKQLLSGQVQFLGRSGERIRPQVALAVLRKRAITNNNG